MSRTLPAIFAVLSLACGVASFCQAPGSEPRNSPKPVTDLRSELAARLSAVKRIYVESFGDDEISKTLQAMVINALDETKRFIVTENKDRADAILKGHSLEKTSQEVHATGGGTQVAAAAGGHSAQVSPSGGSAHGGFAGKALGIEDSRLSTETINDARLAVRLVSQDGDVIWSTTQESTGAKFKSASADVADKVAKQLLRDIDKATSPKT
jgi:curli biogenesis system outer membrane secretion channel CsgG